jgi:integral membrane sensor domain MASE1
MAKIDTAKPDNEKPTARAVEAPARTRPVRLPPLRTQSPGGMGAVLAMLLGVGLLILGLAGIFRDDPLPMPLTIALCLVGAIEAGLGWLTLLRMRAAWAFATAIAGTAGTAFFFSAPKIRDALEIGLGVALVPALVGATTCILLAMAAPDIR